MSHIFISYSRINTGYVKRLEQGLISEGFTVWCDSHLKTGDAWWTVVKRNLSEAKVVIVIMSEASARSAWVLRETAIADYLKKPIIPLLLGGDTDEEAWQMYSFIHHIDVRKGDLPPASFYDDLAHHSPRQKLAGGVRVDGIYLCNTSSPLLKEALRFYSNNTVTTFMISHDEPVTSAIGKDTDHSVYIVEKSMIKFTAPTGRIMKGRFKDDLLSFRITYPGGQQDSRNFNFVPFED